MSLQSPLRQALGPGSAKEGVGHWWAQRLTAIALVPLGLWFVFSMLRLDHGSYEIVRAWIADPAHAVLLILFLVTLLYHCFLGLQVVIEDYLQGAKRVVMLIGMQFVLAIMAVGGLYAIVTISVGGGQ
ncbi:MAG TPA: succinate dehydrogenase, hydrophobic membrane anchor protein [Chromatiales bacterium]|nr:succinate dehydrogenase, hydrophobic membrane anchor protein [Chromatiales bacterium]